jgi:hypothetical protein
MTATGALIMGTFATIWWIVGLRAAGHGALLVYVLPLVVALTLAMVAFRLARRAPPSLGPGDDANERARRDRLVAWASAVEGVAIFLVAGVVLPSTGHRDATAPSIALIVGAHFIPLARGLPARTYYVTAATLIALGLIGFGIADAPMRITVVSAGAAAVLWVTAAAALQRDVWRSS